MLWSYCYTDTMYTISGTRIHQFTRYRHFIYWYHRYMDARYTVSHVHTSLLHMFTARVYMHVLFLSSCHMNHHSYYMYYCFMLSMYSYYMIVSRYWYWYSRYWINKLLICDVWNWVPRGSKSWEPPLESHIYCFSFPVILFYAIRAHVLLSCYMYHVLFLFLILCVH